MTETEKNIINQIKELNSKGYSISEIALELNTYQQKISKLMKENNIENYTKKKCKFLDEDKIVRLYLEGMKVIDLSRRFNAAYATIRNILIKKGVFKNKHV